MGRRLTVPSSISRPSASGFGRVHACLCVCARVGPPFSLQVTVPAENDTGTVFASPSMKKLFKKNARTKTGYYRKLNFFDTRLAFDQIVGTQPKIYHDFENDEDSYDAKR